MTYLPQVLSVARSQKCFPASTEKKIRPILDKVRPIWQKRQFNTHRKGQFEMKLQFFFVSESVSVPSIRKFFRKYSPAPFLPLLVKFDHKFFRPTLFFLGPFWAFLAEISSTWQHCKCWPLTSLPHPRCTVCTYIARWLSCWACARTRIKLSF